MRSKSLFPSSQKSLLLAACIAVTAFFTASRSNAAIIDIDYNLTGGAAFYTATGTASARVKFDVYGVNFDRLVTGSASGATSWNFGGSLTASINDGSGSVSTTQNMTATRRAGAINFDFPLLDLGGLYNLSIDGTAASASSVMNETFEDANLLNNTDWLLSQNYELPAGATYSIAGLLTIPKLHQMPLFPTLLLLMNESGYSSASMSSPVGSSVSASFLNDTLNPGCVLTGQLGNCIVNVHSIQLDFSGVYLTTSSLVATGTSSTMLPAVVPVPAAAWLFGSGLVALMGFPKRRTKQT